MLLKTGFFKGRKRKLVSNYFLIIIKKIPEEGKASNTVNILQN